MTDSDGHTKLLDANGRRLDGRRPDELRSLRFQRDFTHMATGSALVEFGNTKVLCTASVDEEVPRWLRKRGTGWVTAEYSMLPGSSPERVQRRIGGRIKEIQRLIGRSLRTAVDLEALGKRQVTVDCDVLQADGGTRTASICGGFMAMHDAVTRLMQQDKLSASPIRHECAAVSVGLVEGVALLDLPYAEDSRADVDFNVVMTGAGDFVEVQGTAEGKPFAHGQLQELLALAAQGISEIVAAQRAVLSDPPAPR